MSRHPFNLSRWFATVGLVSIASISAVSGWMLSRFLTERLIQQEARLTHEFVDNIVLVEKVSRSFVSGVTFDWKHEDSIEHIARLPDVLRANMYSRERRVVWSSDGTMIGRQFQDNPELDEALRGKVVAHGGEREKREHAHLDERYSYFVEIYSPVREPLTGEVVGVLEVYKTPQALFAAINAAQKAVWIGAALAGIFLYAALFWMVRRADELIRAQGERLVQAETLATVGEMSSAVAHGIRNPVASIRSSAELALESEPAHWRQAAKDIIEQVDRLESWVRQLLSYAQPLLGKPEPVLLGPLLQSSVASFERELQRRNVELSARLGEPLPPVAADGPLLGQVFNSLIANALEAVERDGRIVVALERANGRNVRVRIRDSGPGMTPQQLAGAFKPFHTTKARGLGVGLALAKRVIERFGGSIAIDSGPGRGTTVEVLLPASS